MLLNFVYAYPVLIPLIFHVLLLLIMNNLANVVSENLGVEETKTQVSSSQYCVRP